MRWIAIIIIVCGLASASLWAQDSYYHCHFEVLSQETKDGEIVATLELKPQGWKPVASSVGYLIPVYTSGEYDSSEPVGQVIIHEDTHTATFKTQADGFDTSLLSPGEAVLRTGGTYALECIHPDSPIAHIRKLAIRMIDAYEENDLLNLPLECGMVEEQTELILQELVNDAIFVAQAMREQMDEPSVGSGPWKGEGLFDVMENAQPWMARQFLGYIRARPFKYQGQDWKFSEVFATWLVEGAPTPTSELVYFVQHEWSEWEGQNFVPEYLIKIGEENATELLKQIESEAGEAIDDDKLGTARAILEKAQLLSEAYGGIRSGWIQYRKAKVLYDEGQQEKAIAEYQEARTYMEKEGDLAGQIIVCIDMGHSLLAVNQKKETKRALRILQEAIELSAPLPKDDKTLGPMQALTYRHLGDAYLQLGKKKEAQEAYQIGLECTVSQSPLSLKRRATLHFRLAEWEEAHGSAQQMDYHNQQAVLAYKEYETLLELQKSL